MLSVLVTGAWAMTDDSYAGKTVIVYTGNLRGDIDVYNLMDAAGYDVAAMGAYEFVYGDATTGYMYHSNFYRYYTQAELLNGAAEVTYNQNYAGTATAIRAEKDAAKFSVVSSNVMGSSSYYSFESSKVVTTNSGLKVAFFGLTDPLTSGEIQDIYSDGLTFGDADTCGSEQAASLAKNNDIVVCLANTELSGSYGNVTLDGSDSANWNGETNLGDLTADALKWYAENYIDGIKDGVEVVAIQNGGNCDNFVYTGDVTDVDLLKALPFSPMGVGVIYVTGSELLETLEAATQQSDCPGWAQVSGIKYTVDTTKEYDEGEAYGNYYVADSINRVTITSINGEDFKEDATYAVVADNYLINGNDTYYTFKKAKAVAGNYINNGNGTKVRDIVALYIKNVLKGNVGEEYAEPQGRITVKEIPFEDVNVNSWSYEGIKFAYQCGLFKGVTASEFEPKMAMNRAMIVTVLYRMEESPDVSKYQNVFTDVQSGMWYTDAVLWAENNGIVNGVSASIFDPASNVTREQMVTILYRYYTDFKGNDASGQKVSLEKFTDSGSISSYAEEAFEWAVGTGLINGMTKDTLAPTGSATREQVATIFMRFAELFQK